MVISGEVVFGTLVSVGLLILLVFVVFFMRLERVSKRRRLRNRKPSR
jgi:hypothetical protein